MPHGDGREYPACRLGKPRSYRLLYSGGASRWETPEGSATKAGDPRDALRHPSFSGHSSTRPPEHVARSGFSTTSRKPPRSRTGRCSRSTVVVTREPGSRKTLYQGPIRFPPAGSPNSNGPEGPKPTLSRISDSFVVLQVGRRSPTASLPQARPGGCTSSRPGSGSRSRSRS